jgi:peptide/nickel transport system ATP-binding protein
MSSLTLTAAPDAKVPTSPVLSVRNLHVRYDLDGHSVHAVSGVSFDISARETYAIVGESGSGKSTVALSLLNLTPVVAGSVTLAGQDLTKLDRNELSKVRGSRIAMVFQEPATSLNPVLTVGYQITETIRLHEPMGRRAARARAVEMLRRVGLSDPERRLDQYPHELSGGMRQRVMIAMALSCRPEVLVADEPTTALDVTVQAEILDLLDRLRDEFGTAIVLITHDIGVVAETADRVGVMYAGQIIEEAPTNALFAEPRHPYTRGLLASVPRVDRAPDGALLPSLSGTPPSMRAVLEGCPFRPRCSEAMEKCAQTPPRVDGNGRYVRCWLHA